MTALAKWQASKTHLPLLLRGARQIGKTFLVREFAKSYFDKLLEINFELAPQYSSCFDSLFPRDILERIELLSDNSIVPGKTLLFLDEIQFCPKAIMALRYFKENYPDLHVIAAGSLLEFVLEKEDFSFPVGRIQYLYLKPLSFQEYLMAKNHDNLLTYLEKVTLESIIPNEIHEKLMHLVREYSILGGMPMVVQEYLDQASFRECQNFQTSILRTYADDFHKYNQLTKRPAKYTHLQQVFQKTPGMIGQQVKYSALSPNTESVYIKEAILNLNRAGVITPVYATSGAGLPLNTYVNEKKYKLLFLDIGLVQRSTKIDMELLFKEDFILLNQGALAEQFVGQELLAYQDPWDEPNLFYWYRDKKNSMAEVDYLISIDQQIIPIEVKAGKTGSLRSLQLFLKEHQAPFGVRVSSKEFSFHHHVLSIPFYLIHALPRLVRLFCSDRKKSLQNRAKHG